MCEICLQNSLKKQQEEVHINTLSKGTCLGWYALFSSSSPSWMSRCPAFLLPALRLWLPWSESSERSWVWPCLAWMSSSTYTHTLSPSSTSTSSQVLRLHRRLQRPNVCGVLTILLSFSGYEGVPQFFSSLLSHIESVLGKETSAGTLATGCPESAQTTGDPSASSTGLWDIIIDCSVFQQFPRTNEVIGITFLLFFWGSKLSSFQDFASIVRSYLYVTCEMIWSGLYELPY